MDLLSLNDDLIINLNDSKYEKKSELLFNNEFYFWNITNKLPCIKVTENLILFNYDNIKFYYDINEKEIMTYNLNNYDIFTLFSKDFNKIKYYISKNNSEKISFYLDYIHNIFINIDFDIDIDVNEDKYYINNKLILHLIKNNQINILKYPNLFKKYINDINTINKSENIYINLENLFHLNVNIYELVNKKLNDIIEESSDECIEININIYPDYFPKFIFLIDFNNIKLKKNIINYFDKVNSLEELIKILLKILNDENIVDEVDNLENSNKNILLIQQILAFKINKPCIKKLILEILKELNQEEKELNKELLNNIISLFNDEEIKKILNEENNKI